MIFNVGSGAPARARRQETRLAPERAGTHTLRERAGGNMAYIQTIFGVLAFAFALGAAAPASGQTRFDPTNPEHDDFVQGNILFLAYHEAGHLILDQILNVDQRGDRLTAELYADDIATWLMLPDPEEQDQDEEILAAMEGWLRSAEGGDTSAPTENPHYPDDAERAARIACLVYGSNPQLYGELREIFPEAIAALDCSAEVEALHGDFEAWFGEQLIPPAAADGGTIRVAYEPGDALMRPARDYLVESRTLDDLAEDLSQFVRLPNDITLVARRCGAGAAEFRYNASARQITACYEAVDWLMDNADAELSARPARTDTGAQGAAASDDMGSGGARVARRPRPRPR